MSELLNHSNRVRYRTEKGLFFHLFAAKFLTRGAANQAPCVLNDEGVFGLVR